MKSLFVIQPSFVPWFGQFAMILQSNHLVFLDNVQYDKGGWRNRNYLYGPNGKYLVTIPVKTKGKNLQLLNQVKIDYSYNWSQKFLKSIEHTYSKCTFFDEVFPNISQILQRKYEYLIDLNLDFFTFIFDYLDICPVISKASDYKLPHSPNGRLITLCEITNSKIYHSGPAAKSYLDLETFKSQSIVVKYFKSEDIRCDFDLDYLLQNKVSVIDLIFRVNRENIVKLLENYGSWENVE